MARKTAFERWWTESRNGLGPHLGDFTPSQVAKIAFEAGRQSVPTSKKLRKALAGVLDMLDDWDRGGFDGFGEVNAAEKALGRPLSKVR